MEYIENSLEDYIDQQESKGKLRDDVVTNIAIQSIDILKELHKTNYIHRDIKPENFRVDNNGKVYIIDLGTASVYIQNGVHIKQDKA